MFHTCLMAYKSVNECFIGVALSFLGTTDTCALNMSSSDLNFYFIGYGNSTIMRIYTYFLFPQDHSSSCDRTGQAPPSRRIIFHACLWIQQKC